MVQFYLLSVVLNILAGLILILAKPLAEDAQEATMAGLPFYETKNFRLIVGIATAFTGLMKILTVAPGDVPILGDIIPAAMGIVGGACLLYEFFISSSSVKVSLSPLFENLFENGRKYIGIASLVIAFLHFIVPGALFL